MSELEIGLAFWKSQGANEEVNAEAPGSSGSCLHLSKTSEESWLSGARMERKPRGLLPWQGSPLQDLRKEVEILNRQMVPDGYLESLFILRVQHSTFNWLPTDVRFFLGLDHCIIF